MNGMNQILANIFPLILMIVIFYFLLIRPQQKQMKERQKMLNELKIGDKVLTVGGIIGIITSVTDNEIELEISKNVKVKAVKSAVSNLLKE
ncbi:MAG: preprotein translocase subunit YajC [Elusimicrobiales bacterium]|nr:preprotein translocase subunit YajC [Elusimicrobiales bacterium]